MTCVRCHAEIVGDEMIILNVVTREKSLVMCLCSQACLIDQVAGSQAVLIEKGWA